MSNILLALEKLSPNQLDKDVRFMGFEDIARELKRLQSSSPAVPLDSEIQRRVAMAVLCELAIAQGDLQERVLQCLPLLGQFSASSWAADCLPRMLKAVVEGTDPTPQDIIQRRQRQYVSKSDAPRVNFRHVYALALSRLLPALVEPEVQSIAANILFPGLINWIVNIDSISPATLISESLDSCWTLFDVLLKSIPSWKTNNVELWTRCVGLLTQSTPESNKVDVSIFSITLMSNKSAFRAALGCMYSICEHGPSELIRSMFDLCLHQLTRSHRDTLPASKSVDATRLHGLFSAIAVIGRFSTKLLSCDGDDYKSVPLGGVCDVLHTAANLVNGLLKKSNSNLAEDKSTIDLLASALYVIEVFFKHGSAALLLLPAQNIPNLSASECVVNSSLPDVTTVAAHIVLCVNSAMRFDPNVMSQESNSAMDQDNGSDDYEFEDDGDDDYGAYADDLDESHVVRRAAVQCALGMLEGFKNHPSARYSHWVARELSQFVPDMLLRLSVEQESKIQFSLISVLSVAMTVIRPYRISCTYVDTDQAHCMISSGSSPDVTLIFSPNCLTQLAHCLPNVKQTEIAAKTELLDFIHQFLIVTVECDRFGQKIRSDQFILHASALFRALIANAQTTAKFAINAKQAFMYASVRAARSLLCGAVERCGALLLSNSLDTSFHFISGALSCGDSSSNEVYLCLSGIITSLCCSLRGKTFSIKDDLFRIHAMMRGFSFSDTAIEDTAFNLLPQCVLVVNSAIVANTQSSSFFDFISQLSLVLAASMNYQNTINLGEWFNHCMASISKVSLSNDVRIAALSALASILCLQRSKVESLDASLRTSMATFLPIASSLLRQSDRRFAQFVMLAAIELLAASDKADIQSVEAQISEFVIQLDSVVKPGADLESSILACVMLRQLVCHSHAPSLGPLISKFIVVTATCNSAVSNLVEFCQYFVALLQQLPSASIGFTDIISAWRNPVKSSDLDVKLVNNWLLPLACSIIHGTNAQTSDLSIGETCVLNSCFQLISHTSADIVRGNEQSVCAANAVTLIVQGQDRDFSRFLSTLESGDGLDWLTAVYTVRELVQFYQVYLATSSLPLFEQYADSARSLITSILNSFKAWLQSSCFNALATSQSGVEINETSSTEFRAIVQLVICLLQVDCAAVVSACLNKCRESSQTSLLAGRILFTALAAPVSAQFLASEFENGHLQHMLLAVMDSDCSTLADKTAVAHCLAAAIPKVQANISTILDCVLRLLPLQSSYFHSYMVGPKQVEVDKSLPMRSSALQSLSKLIQSQQVPNAAISSILQAVLNLGKVDGQSRIGQLPFSLLSDAVQVMIQVSDHVVLDSNNITQMCAWVYSQLFNQSFEVSIASVTQGTCESSAAAMQSDAVSDEFQSDRPDLIRTLHSAIKHLGQYPEFGMSPAFHSLSASVTQLDNQMTR